ncbi:MAG TPA: trypsin-like peptidase domain-containing protein [Pseudonocardiaceae bacterium]|jgi:S1-C subfamily serine protease|nr:trypsin-like peptidase domain-containing protein [Pseudonocardiaceae bacterium]
MSEFDPRWPTGRQDNPGQPGDQEQPGAYGQPGQQGQPGYHPQGGYYGQDYRAGQGLGSPSPDVTWPNPAYRPGDYGHTAQFGQPGPWQPGAQSGPTDQFGQPGQPGQPTTQWGAPYGTPYQQPSRRRPMRSVGLALGAVGLSVLVGLGIGRLAWPSDTANSTATSGGNQNFGSVPGTSNGSGGSSNPSSSAINPSAIAAKVDPGLVDINTVLGYQSAEAAGTGIVLTSNGEILTNNHVVEGATSIKVTDIGNGKTYDATVTGYDRTQDIAVIQLQGASGLATETLGDSSKVSVGDAIVGIGNAGGSGGTPSTAAGTVTALNQSITASDDSSSSSEKLDGLIQVNANIQAGDSGGSLANSSGQVIGVDTAASSGYQFSGGDVNGQGDSSAHQGYAIPINQAITLAHQIIAGTASTAVHIGKSAFLGVTVSDAGASQQGQGGFGQSGSGQNGSGQNGSGQSSGAASGAQIAQTLPGGPADAAGLQQGDVITALNGTAVDSATTLTNLMDQHHPTDKLTVTYTDTSGQQHTTTVTPIAGPVG